MSEPTQAPSPREWPSERARWTRFSVLLIAMFLLTKAAGFALWGEPLGTHLVAPLLGSLVFAWFFSLRVPAQR